MFGPGHIISSAAGAKRTLQVEMAALPTRRTKLEGRRPEAELEEIDPRGRMVRVNLRPMLGTRDEVGERKGREDGVAAEWLVEAMVESARRTTGDPKLMKRRLAAAVKWCRRKSPGEAAELERIASQAEESGYPALHHSPAYARAYRPAYRVVLTSCLGQEIGYEQSRRPEAGSWSAEQGRDF